MKKNTKLFAYVKNNMYLCKKFQNMKLKEEKIASFQFKKERLQLLKVTKTSDTGNIAYFQVRLNRRLIESNYSECHCRKVFANLVTSNVLQLTI